jgi:hypothetical protein
MRFKIISVVTGLALLASALPAQAAGLTSAQVTAVVSLLQSFDVGAETIAHVQMVLGGQSSGEQERHASGSEPERHPGNGTGMATSSSSGMMPPGQAGKMICNRRCSSDGRATPW